MTAYDYLIVGGGMTADAAIRGIREVDDAGTIGVIAAERHAPYNRPPLSKGLWKEASDAEEGLWRGTGETDATLHLGRRAVQLDAAARRLMDDAGDEYTYQRLLLATGGTPRRLEGAPDSVVYFRSLDDYRDVRRLADEGKRFIVVGGGFIGSEMAAALCQKGCAVTMVVPEAGIGARVFPADLARFVARYYRERGVVVHLNDSVNRVATGARGGYAVGVHTAGPLTADAVVAGLGIEPNVELARQAGLSVDNGIVVDHQLQAGANGIFAAGDVARFFNPVLGTHLRVEHEDNANTMGRLAGRNMARAGETYDHLPFFYSDLFDLGYEAVGEVDARLDTVADWKEPFREGVVYYLSDGRVRGVLLWNTWGQVDAARALIAAKETVTPAQLKGRLPA